ncbi:protein SPA1-RELATED 3-like isoform X3 [Juglans regia]|nr:protein SPA1-RELATED 3-like isoform X3 [Juglans regia]
MSSLRHRVLPPQLLLKWPKEASFCLWLLHPEPSIRPKISELLQSEFLNEPRLDFKEREAAGVLRERTEEQELLLEFLLLIQQRKQEAVNKLQDTVSFLCSDVEEAMKQKTILRKKSGSCPELGKNDYLISSPPSMNIVDSDDSTSLGSRKRFRPGLKIHNTEECDDNLDDGLKSDTLSGNSEIFLSRRSRLMKDFKKLESAYFLTRCRPIKPSGKPVSRHSPISSDGKGSIVVTERSSANNLVPKDQSSEGRQSGWINPFLEGLCKYLSFSKLKVKADLKQGDLLNSSNLVCSLSFDRDGQFFATAGVNKKIKVFECDTIIDEDRDIHYPVVEMASGSKLSSICWNSYIKSQIASSNFEGVVQLWDVARSQSLMEMREHERRVWSIDFSSADPTMLASGSDDGSVKLWSINQGASIGTIKAKANVCCVQFPLDSGRSLAFGSADHRIYYYDLRNLRTPLCTLIGHNKTVSYVKFVDAMNIVSASTDNTLKLWDLSMCASRVIDTPLQSLTGHMNVKNFVGLSVSDGYIATGSETNEVFIYHKAFPMPALSFKFDNTDPLSGHEVGDAAQFISSVCWRGQSSTLVAANSAGNIKILEMV